MRFGAHINANTSFDQTVYELRIPTDSPAVIDRSLLILEDWAHAVSFEPAEIDKERGVILEEWRTGLGAGARILDAQLPVLLKDSRYAAAPADRHAGDPSHVPPRSSEEVLHRLVSARPDGGDRRRRLRSGRHRDAHQVAFRLDSGCRVPQAATGVRRPRSAGHALHDRDRPRGDADDRQRLQHHGGARPDDARRLSPADDRADVRGAAVGAALRDGAEARRAVPGRADQSRHLRAVDRSDDAQRARAGWRRREGTGGALRRSRSRRPVRLHADRARSLPADHPESLRAARLVDRRAHLGIARRRVHPQLHAGRTDPGHRLRVRARAPVPAGDHARRRQWPGPRLGPRSQSCRRR